MIIQEKEIRIE